MSKVALKRIENFEKSRALASRARDLIPGGAHTYSKGADQFPLNSPGFIERADGCRVVDVDGNEFVDWGMGLRSVVLGYSYPRVIEAVQREIAKGPNFLLPSPVEVELAELLTRLVPSAEMVKFAKNGSNVTTAAIRLARAYTGRSYIALCKEHPFFSFDDWFIGTTPPNSGIPEEAYHHSLTFHYNDIESLEALFREYPGQIAGVIMEPVTLDEPKDNFLEKVRALTEQHGSLLIFDEMISGFRWHLQGAQAYFNVIPDMSTFGKAIGNGFSVSVLAGRRDVMELGGIYHDKPRVFLLSTTHGAETHSLAACVATIREIEEKNVIDHIWKIGKAFQDGFNDLAHEMGLGDYVSCIGYPCNAAIITKDRDGKVSLPLRTLFMQEMTAQGVLIPSVVVSYAHTEAEVELTLEAARETFNVYGRALDEGIDKFLVGPPVKPVFRRFN